MNQGATTPGLELAAPHRRWEASYRAYVAEIVARGETFIPFPLGFDASDFDAMLDKLDRCSRGIDIPGGFVAHSTFWLVLGGEEVVGVSNIRHSLTPALRRAGGHIGYGVRPSARGRGYGTEILTQSLRRASELGLAMALISCGKANVRSSKVILRNGGRLDSEELIPDRGEVVQRFWVDVRAFTDRRRPY